MEAYALGILPLIKFLLQFINLNEINSEEVVLAEDLSVADNLNSIKDYLDKLTAIDPKYCQFSKTTKSHLVVKEKNWWKQKPIY